MRSVNGFDDPIGLAVRLREKYDRSRCRRVEKSLDIARNLAACGTSPVLLEGGRGVNQWAAAEAARDACIECGACVLDLFPGYGKTYIAVHTAQHLLHKHSGGMGVIVVVCPRSMKQKWTDMLKHYGPPQSKAEFMVLSFEKLRGGAAPANVVASIHTDDGIDQEDDVFDDQTNWNPLANTVLARSQMINPTIPRKATAACSYTFRLRSAFTRMLQNKKGFVVIVDEVHTQAHNPDTMRFNATKCLTTSGAWLKEEFGINGHVMLSQTPCISVLLRLL